MKEEEKEEGVTNMSEGTAQQSECREAVRCGHRPILWSENGDRAETPLLPMSDSSQMKFATKGTIK